MIKEAGLIRLLKGFADPDKPRHSAPQSGYETWAKSCSHSVPRRAFAPVSRSYERRHLKLELPHK